jgi:uncharacterized protein (TIGR00266 family)
MQIKILYRPSQSLAEVSLSAGESVLAESGALVGMTPNVSVTTQAAGFLGGLKRVFGGETIFRNAFRADGAPGEVLFSTPLAGDMAILDVGRKQWCVQNNAYVASAPDVKVDTKSGGLRGFLSGAGFFVLQTSGSGLMLVGGFGAVEPVEVKGSIVVDTGHLLAWESTLKYAIVRTGGGVVASWLSGERFVCSFSGEGTIYVQSRNAAGYGRSLGPLLPPRAG